MERGKSWVMASGVAVCFRYGIYGWMGLDVTKNTHCAVSSFL